jgi:hypothetical protein
LVLFGGKLDFLVHKFAEVWLKCVKQQKEFLMKQVKVFLLVMLFVFSVFNIAWAGWSANDGDQYISSLVPDHKTVHAPSAAVGPSGNLYAVWVQGSAINDPYSIYFSMSTDNGHNWTGTVYDRMICANDGQKVYNLGIYGARRTDIAVDSEERIFVVWPEIYIQADFDSTVEIILVMSHDTAATWIYSDINFPISDTNSSETANSPAICVDPNDNIHVVWNQTSAGTTEIHYSFSSDHGYTWTGRTADRIISFPDGNNGFPSHIASDDDGNIHVIWSEPEGGSYHINYGVMLSGQTNFSSETADSAISIAQANTIDFPRIDISSAGAIHVVYAVGDNAEYVGTTDGGLTWNDRVIWVGVGYDIYGPDVVTTSNGTVVAIVDEEYPGTDDRQNYAFYSFDGGLSWSDTPDLVGSWSCDNDRELIPNVLCTPGDTLHVIYYGNIGCSNSYQEMYYSRGDTLATGGGPGCDYVPGDANGDGNVMGNDVTYSVRYFKGIGTPPPDSCWNPDAEEWLYSGGDANGNCSYTGSDVTFLVAYFKGYNPEILYCEHTPPIGGGLSSLKAWNRPER